MCVWPGRFTTQVFALARLQGVPWLRQCIKYVIHCRFVPGQAAERAQAIRGEENRFMAKRESSAKDLGTGNNQAVELTRSEDQSELLRELVAHLRQNRNQLREEWVGRISETRLLTAMTKEEIFAEATSVYDSYVEALETETFEA